VIQIICDDKSVEKSIGWYASIYLSPYV